MPQSFTKNPKRRIEFNSSWHALPLWLHSMKILLTIFLFLSAISAFGQDESLPTDTLIIPQNVRIFKDARLDMLNTRAALMANEEKNKLQLFKPIVSTDGKKKVTGSIYTTKGYRIIVYNGPDRNEAIQAKNNFTKAFPDKRSYMSYNVPSYKIKVGDFEEKGEANEFLRLVSRMFPSSFIVPDIVTIKNINVSE